MKEFINQIDKRLGSFYVPCVLLLMSIILFVFGYPFVKQTVVESSLNSVATKTIRANKTVEDTQATEKAKDVAAKTVATVYAMDDSIGTKQYTTVSKFFEVMTNYRQKLAEPLESGQTSDDKVNSLVSQFFKSLSSENADLKSYAYTFSETLLKQLLKATDDNFNTYASITKDVVQSVLKDNIYPTSTDLSNAKDKANSLILSQTYVDTTREIVKDLVTPAIVATMTVNEQATKSQVDQAKAQTAAVMITQGDVIVRQGEVITSSIYHKLELLGMTNNYYNVQTLVGYLIVLILQFGLVWYFILRQAKEITKRNMYVNLYAFMAVFETALLVVFNLMQNGGIEYISLVAPIGLAPFVMIPKSKRRLSVVLVAFLVTIYFFIADSSSTVQVPLVWKFYALMGYFSTVVVSGRKKKPLKQHLMVLIILYLSWLAALAMYYNIDLISQTFGMMIIYVCANVFLTILILRLGQPYFDLLFEDKAVLKMLELSNPNQPLLKELITKAPGTYHHSIMVANLSANAVEAIGGDSLFTRVACYYHDIGKLKNPLFFTENLPAGLESPHKLLTPYQSRDIIFEHVTEGVKRLKKAQLPQSIIDICAEHHGTTIMKYFYIMAKKQDETVSEEDFRYPGPKPQTKESAVISIADTVEAATKAMPSPTKEAITKLVHDTIQSRIMDGQLDEAPITLAELKIVEDSLINGLSGSYHTRIQYPKMIDKRG